MKNNLIEKFELIDGFAVFNNNFKIVTANEAMYRFMGISLEYHLMNVIHQVDMEDFINVCNSLRLNHSKNMVIRMRRSDNSYRWMLISIKKCPYNFIGKTVQNSNEEYFELHASDIIAMKCQNEELHKNMRNLKRMLAMENDLFYTYDYSTELVSIYHFIDNDIEKIKEEPIDEFYNRILDNKLIAPNDITSFNQLCDEIKQGVVSYRHKLNISFDVGQELDLFEIHGFTIITDNKAMESVGSIRNIAEEKICSYSINTIDYNNNDSLLPYDKIKDFCNKNIKYNHDCKITLFLIEFNNYESYINQYGKDFTDELCNDLIHTAKVQIGCRGIVYSIKENLIALAVKDIYTDIDIRAFVESLRTNIKWQYKHITPNNNLSLTMGIANYPNNGYNLDNINKKLNKAFEIAKKKQTDCFVIYREHLHGEID